MFLNFKWSLPLFHLDQVPLHLKLNGQNSFEVKKDKITNYVARSLSLQKFSHYKITYHCFLKIPFVG